jgi:hypothetical protein
MRRKILTLLVAVVAGVSYSTMHTATENYVESAKATHNLGGELTDLTVEETTVYVTFQFTNTSSLDIILQKIAFNLYANGKFLGNFDRRDRPLLPPGQSLITVTAELHPVYMENLKQEQQSETILWFITGGTVIELPFKEMTVTTSIQEYWVTE